MTDTGVHIAIVMDGNGRWATKRMMPRATGHIKGANIAEKIIAIALDLGVEVLTLYAFSTENWKRPGFEVEALFKLFSGTLTKKSKKMYDDGIQIKCIGRRDRLPAAVLSAIDESEALTAENTRLKLRVCIDYGGQDEIVRVVKRFAQDVAEGKAKPDDFDEACFTALSDLYDVPPPDLIIRTGGDMRLSNFLLWHTAYSEFLFDDTLWPDFTEEKFKDAVESLKQRRRRYGGVKS